MKISSVGFIGTGNMGSAIARAIAANHPEVPLLLANRHIEKAAALAEELPDARAVTNEEAARESELLFLAVKPQFMESMLTPLRDILKSRKTPPVLVTMAAAISCEKLRSMAGGDYAVIRMMPNTPAAIGEGVVQYCSLGASEELRTAFAALISGAGLVDAVEESMIDVCSVLSGCGPAFAYMFIEALCDGAVACGMPRDRAYLWAAQTLRGSAAMVLAGKGHPGELKDAVCSPGGSTIQGVRALENGGFRAAAMEAVIAAFEKTKTMG